MPILDLKNLPWLRAARANFSAQLNEAVAAETNVGDRLQQLATFALSSNQLHKLSKEIAKAQSAGKNLSPLTPFKLGLLSNTTTSLIAAAMTGTAARYGIALEVIEGDYDQILQQAIDPQSEINAARPDAVLVALDHHGVQLADSYNDPEFARASLDGAADFIRKICDALGENSGATIVLQTIPPSPETLFGHLDGGLAGTQRWILNELNRAMLNQEIAKAVVVDIAGLAEAVGLSSWYDPVQWNLAKLAFSQDIDPVYADHVCRVLASMRGKSRKCLVLDLDNTLWGGIIGDDGLNGIVLGQGDPTGEAFLSVQRMALALRNRGIVLAVSSKNEDATARQPFRDHPEMLLREEHIAVFQANWSDKAANLCAIAETLNIGLDALVLLDDNPAEREQVRQELPMVAVPELPSDPAYYSSILSAAGYFEAISYSTEDGKRNAYYQDNAKRVALLKQATNLESYLTSLEMVATFQGFNDRDRSRIAQLINKSNQFNLTTRRYSESDIARLETDDGMYGLQIRLADRFGDNGMISVLICERKNDGWLIDTWLMSCRVLGRQVEQAVLQEVAAQAIKEGARELIGRFIPSSKNQMVREHYKKLGFNLVEEYDDGSSLWSLQLGEFDPLPLPMKIVRPIS